MVRLLAPLLLCSLVVAAPADLRPRYGNGWTGFKPGSALRMKVTREAPMRVPFVQIEETLLKKVTKLQLRLERTTKNQLTDDKTVGWWVPLAGEAMDGEKESRKRMENEKIQAAGRTWDCSVQQITVTGKTGRRVITEWTARNPRLRIKRLEKWYGPDGKPTTSRSIMLSKPPQARTVGEKKVVCIGYRGLSKTGANEERSETWHSRQVPGDLAGGKIEFFVKGKSVTTLHFKVLKFETK
ncbi:MAG: hypothetical protein AAGD14_14775 [Planctomycetota bacterium]